MWKRIPCEAPLCERRALCAAQLSPPHRSLEDSFFCGAVCVCVSVGACMVLTYLLTLG